MAEATKEDVELALEPRVVMAAMHTTMIRASMTAYSTAVGPSSFFRKRTRFFTRARDIAPPSEGGAARRGPARDRYDQPSDRRVGPETDTADEPGLGRGRPGE